MLIVTFSGSISSFSSLLQYFQCPPACWDCTWGLLHPRLFTPVFLPPQASLCGCSGFMPLASPDSSIPALTRVRLGFAACSIFFGAWSTSFLYSFSLFHTAHISSSGSGQCWCRCSYRSSEGCFCHAAKRGNKEHLANQAS